jgi:hypothetical protein
LHWLLRSVQSIPILDEGKRCNWKRCSPCEGILIQVNNYYLHRVGESVKKARAAFRKSVGFSEDEYVTLLAVGENQKEATFSLKKFGGGLQVFSEQSEIKTINNAHFKLLVLLP